MTLDKIVVVKRDTELEDLQKRHVTRSQVRFYLASQGQSLEVFEARHEGYHQSLDAVQGEIPTRMRSQVVSKDQLATYQFGDSDLVVVVGDEGLVVNAAKYVGSQPVIAVNAYRAKSKLETCRPRGFQQALAATLEERAEIELLTMAQATLDDGQVLYALNDIRVGHASHVSSRYLISYRGDEERQSSDGVLVSTGTGSTGWLTSIVTTAQKLTGAPSELTVPFAGNSGNLAFVALNTYPSDNTGTSIGCGYLSKGSPLVMTSEMPQNGVIFGDGVEQDYLQFNAGRTATIAPADKRVNLVQYG